jgi:transcriptional regulator of met regulon
MYFQVGSDGKKIENIRIVQYNCPTKNINILTNERTL